MAAQPVPYDPSNHFWVVGDTNPTTQLYQTASVNGFVANNAAAYATWLGDGRFGYSMRIRAMSTDGSGHPRLTLDSSANLQTNQRWYFVGLDGTPLGNGLQQITVIDSVTIDLDGVTFIAGNVADDAQLQGATIIDTLANLNETLNTNAVDVDVPEVGQQTSASVIQLTNPMAVINYINPTADIEVRLSPANEPNSPPLGRQNQIWNISPLWFDVELQPSGGGIPSVTIQPGEFAFAINKDNTVPEGDWLFRVFKLISFSADAKDLEPQALDGTDYLIGLDNGPDMEIIHVTGGLEFTGSASIQRSALTGDVTASAGSNATAIAGDAVTNAKLANMAQATAKGRAVGAGTGDPTDLTATQLMSILATVAGFKVGNFTRNLATASGTQAITGVGFQPRLVLFFAALGSAGAGKVGSLGFADGASVGGNYVDLNGAVVVNTSNTCILLSATGTTDFNFVGTVTMDSDGFTLTWTKNGSPTGTGQISYLAYR